jgi:hypothetical protein
MRSMPSGGAFHHAEYHATQQAFLKHELGFRYFGGVFRRQRYDNLKSAVKIIPRGHREGRDRAFRRLPFALGISGRVLQAGARCDSMCVSVRSHEADVPNACLGGRYSPQRAFGALPKCRTAVK